jgi:hypothetical protein
VPPKPVHFDACLFSEWTGSDGTHVAVHVDDLLVASSNERGIADLQKMLLSKFRSINTSRDCFTYLGMNITSFNQGVRVSIEGQIGDCLVQIIELCL